MPEFLITVLKIIIPFAIIFTFVPLLVWLERKGSAYIQDRPGPNRAAILGIRLGGLIHPIADVVKLIFKEDICPSQANKFYYIAAPFIALSVACVTFMVIPFASPYVLDGQTVTFQAAQLNVGVLYILAMTSLSVYGIMLAGWSSNNKYALLGGLRSSAQMVSYELAMGLALIPLIMWSGSLSLNDIVTLQTSHIWRWNFIYEPLACIIFIIAAFAETNRTPFDLPEGESELVAGYHVEYSSLKFAMFFMAEYVNMVIASALIVTLFFGGWQIPFLPTETLRDNAQMILNIVLALFALFSTIVGVFLILKFKKRIYGDKRDYEVIVLGIPAVLVGFVLILFLLFVGKIPLSTTAGLWITALLQIGMFLFKTLFMCWVFIWVRWTVPRIRYDQLMNLGWKILLPLAMVNIVITAVRMVLQ
jgi:NADH-quinone oxidoreductase subunit H